MPRDVSYHNPTAETKSSQLTMISKRGKSQNYAYYYVYISKEDMSHVAPIICVRHETDSNAENLSQ